MIMKKIIVIFLYGFLLNVQAEVLVPFQPSNKLKATVSVDIALNKSTHLYTYSYTLTNDLKSEQSVDNFAFEIGEKTKIIDATAPVGWSFGRYSYKNIFEFSSTEGITEEHVITLPNGGIVIRSPYNIKPGTTLCCFTFKTKTAPSKGNAYIQGYAPTPQSRGGAEDGYDPDLSTFGIKSISVEDNSFVTSVNVPK